jgi:hypothetical protein
MKRPIIGFAIVMFCLAAAPVQAAFHLWRMTELFSNADGTIQFLELGDGSNGEQFLAGNNLTSSSTGGSHSYEFPSNLNSSATANKRFLVGTEGFAALGVVTPDFVVPNGFFFQNGGTINFAGVDTWNHAALPTDGRSMQRSGNLVTNSPQNFAGQSGTVTLSASALNFQALWYRSPAESESGWGVNITHQGNILFATWFTYDLDGSQMWLVGPAVTKTTGNTFTGDLYRTTGPAFNSVPFNPGAIVATPVGTITFTFTDSNAGTMTTVVNGASVSKPITKQIYSTVSTCTANGTPGATLNFQDLWYKSPAESESGWGVNLTHQGDILFATWFTYDSTGKGMWVVGPNTARTTGNTFSGPLYRTTGPAFNANPWLPSGVVATPVGNATFSFTDTNNGTFMYTLNNVTQTKSITRQVYSTPATVCRQ